MVVMADFWLGMEHDPDSLIRVKRSVELCQAQSGMRVLDVGCYHCVAKQFFEKDIEYFGIDVQRYTDDVILIDIDGGFKLPIVFDRILCLEVLEHLKYPRRVLESVRDHLNENGIAVVSLPNEATIWHRIRALFGIIDPQALKENCKHLHLPNISQARSFLYEYFHITKESPYIVLPRTLPKILRTVLMNPLRLLAFVCPSLFSRGTIFVLRIKYPKPVRYLPQ